MKWWPPDSSTSGTAARAPGMLRRRQTAELVTPPGVCHRFCCVLRYLAAPGQSPFQAVFLGVRDAPRGARAAGEERGGAGPSVTRGVSSQCRGCPGRKALAGTRQLPWEGSRSGTCCLGQQESSLGGLALEEGSGGQRRALTSCTASVCRRHSWAMLKDNWKLLYVLSTAHSFP